jgi:hypothetical protein
MDFELVPALACLVHRCNKRNERAEKLDRVEIADAMRRLQHDDLTTNVQSLILNVCFDPRLSEYACDLCRFYNKPGPSPGAAVGESRT